MGCHQLYSYCGSYNCRSARGKIIAPQTKSNPIIIDMGSNLFDPWIWFGYGRNYPYHQTDRDQLIYSCFTGMVFISTYVLLLVDRYNWKSKWLIILHDCWNEFTLYLFIF